MSPKKRPDSLHSLEKIIEKDYSQVVHDLVTKKFGKLRRLTSKKRVKTRANRSFVANFPSNNQKQPDTTFNTEQMFTFSSPCGPNDVPNGIFFTSTPANKGFDDLSTDDDGAPGRNSIAKSHQCPKKGGRARRSLNMTNSFYHDSRNTTVENPLKNNCYNEETLDPETSYLQTINRIYALEKDIAELAGVTKWGCQQQGYIGSVPHIAATKQLLIANLTKDALIESIAKNDFFPPSQRINCPKGEIIVDNILVESNNNYIDDNKRLCYYTVLVNHGTTILSSDVLAPDCHGKVEFPASMVFDDVNHDFLMKISLFKLELSQFSDEGPHAKLIGEKLVSNRNLNTTTVVGCGEIAYINLNYSLDTGRGPLQGPMVIKKVVRKNFRETKVVSDKVWGVLRRTDLSVYGGAQYSRPKSILRMTRCKSCQPCQDNPNTIVLDMVKSHSSSLLYLFFNDESDFQEWLRAISFAVWVSKKWQY